MGKIMPTQTYRLDIQVDGSGADKNLDNLRKTLNDIEKSTDGASRAIDDTAKSTKGLADSTGKGEKNVSLFNQAVAGMQKVGMAASAALGGITLAVGMATKDAMGFEAAMAGVKKVIDFDTPESFKQMGDDIISLSQEIPMAADGLADIMASAGQAGIAQQDLLRFTETAAKMGVAFDITADQAGQAMAEMRVAFNMSQDEVEVLADKINYLGNTSPNNAAQILEVVQRVGSLGEVAGVSSDTIAALSASLTGIAPEVAATSLKNFMLTLSKGESLSKSAKNAFKEMGLDYNQVAKGMKEDSEATILSVLEAAQSVPEHLRAGMLNDAFGSESITAIAQLVTGIDNVSQKLKDVGDASKYAGSMLKEFESMAGTSQAQMDIFNNNIAAVKIALGTALLPAINDIMESLTPLLKQVAEWASANPELVSNIAIAAAAIAGLATALGAIGLVIPVVVAGFTMITSPITIATVAIGALVAAGVYLYRNLDEVKAKATEVFNSLPAPVKEMAQNIKSTFEALTSFLSGAFDFMAPIWSAQFSLIKIIATSAFDFIRGYINTWVAITKAVFIAGVNIFATVFNTGFNLIKNTFTTTFNAINALVRGDMDGVKKAIGDGIKNAANIVKDGVKNILSAFTNLGSQLTRIGRDAVQGFINGVKAKMGEALNTAREMANKVVSTVKSALDIHSPSRVMREIGAWAGEGFVLGVGDKVKDAKQVAENLANALTSTVADLHRQNFMLKNHANPLADLEYKLQFGELAELTDKQKERVLELARANLDLAKSNDINKSISNEIDGTYEKIQTHGMNRIQVLEWQIENTNKYAGASANLIEQLKEQIKHEETLNQLVSAKSKRDGYQGERDKNSYLYRNKTDKYASDRWDLSNQGFDAGQVAEILGMKQQADLMAAMAKMPKSLTMPTLQNNNLGSAVSSAVGGYTDLKTQLDNNLKIIQESLDAGLISEQEAYNERLAQEQAFQEARQNLILSGGENVAKTLADSAKSILGANSKMYRALFAVEKGFAIARSVVAIQQAIALASANPFPLNLAAMATVAAQTASIIGNIKSVAMPVGQAHDGIMSVPKSGTWNLEKGERVLPKHTAQSLDKQLDGMGNDGRAVNITVHNYSGEPTKVETDQNGDIRLIVGQELNKQLQQHVNNPNSEFNKSLKNNYQLQRRL